MNSSFHYLEKSDKILGIFFLHGNCALLGYELPLMLWLRITCGQIIQLTLQVFQTGLHLGINNKLKKNNMILYLTIPFIRQ